MTEGIVANCDNRVGLAFEHDASRNDYIPGIQSDTLCHIYIIAINAVSKIVFDTIVCKGSGIMKGGEQSNEQKDMRKYIFHDINMFWATSCWRYDKYEKAQESVSVTSLHWKL